MNEPNTGRATIALILLLGLCVRLAYVDWYLQVPRTVHYDGYAEIAQSIVMGKGFSVTPVRMTWLRTPGYPLFIAAAWSLAPTTSRFVALLLAQVVVSVATCGLLFAIVNAAFGRRAALAAAFLFALSPSSIIFCALVLAETLQVFWIALAILLGQQLYKSARLPTAIGLGFVWGAAGLTRPEATFLLGALLLPVLAARQQPMLARLSVCATAVLAKIAVMAPWIARNYLVYGTFVLHVPVGGFAFAGAAPLDVIRNEVVQRPPGEENRADQSVIEGMPVARISPRILVLRNERAILEVNRKLTGLGMTNFTHDQRSLLFRIARRLYATWGRPYAWWDHWGVELPGWLEMIWSGSHLELLNLFVVGVVVGWKRRALNLITLSWLLLMTVHTVLFFIMYASARYQASSALFVYVFSGLGVAAIFDYMATGAPTAAGPRLAVPSEPLNGLARVQEGMLACELPSDRR